MRVRGKKLLAAMLSLAMVLSMFVIPAAAAELPEGKTWDFVETGATADWNGPRVTMGANVALQPGGTTNGTFDGLLVDASAGKWDGTYNAGWIQVNQGVVIKVPVTDGAGYHAKITVKANGTNVFKVAGKANSEAKEQGFECVGTDGYVTIEYTANDYLASIKLEYVEGELTAEASMDLDKQEAAIKVGETATVNATVSGGTATAWDCSVEGDAATASVSNDAVSIVGAAQGKATVTVKATVDGKELSKNVTVYVRPATVADVTENAIYTFTGADGKTNYLTNGNVTFTAAQGGGMIVYHSSGTQYGLDVKTNDTLTMTIPEGKKTTVTLKGCAYDKSNWSVGGTNLPKSDDSDPIYTLENATGTVTIKSGGQMYLASITVGAFADATTDPKPEPCDKTPGCTLNKGHTGDCAVPGAGDTWDGAKIDFQALASGMTLPTVKGVTFDGGVTLSEGNSHGLHAENSAGTITMKLSAPAVVTLQGCQYGTSLTGATATGNAGAISMPAAWDKGGDPEYLFESVPAGEFTLSVPKGAWIHSIQADYANTKTPAMQLSTSTVGLKMGATETGTVTALTRFTTGAIQAVAKDTSVATVTVNGNEVAITALKKGVTDVEVTVAGTSLKETVQVVVKPEGEVFAKDIDYSWNSSSNAEGYVALQKEAVNGLLDGLTFTGFEAQVNTHGIPYANNATIAVNLESKATITVKGCEFGAKQNMEVACYAEGDVGKTALGEATAQGPVAVDNDTAGKIITIKNVPAGKVILEFTGGGSWLHGLGIHYSAEIEAGTRNVQIWDFAGKTETGDVDNNITAQGYVDAQNAAKEEGKKVFQETGDVNPNTFAQGPVSFGALTMYQEAKDRPYIETDNAALKALIDSYATEGKYKTEFSDGYAALGGWYCNGAGSASKRYISISKVQAGDTIVLYASSSSGDVTYHVDGPEGQTETFTGGTSNKTPFAVIAQETGTYKIWPEGGKPVYHRVKLIPGIGVSGSIDLPAGFNATGYKVKFTNQTTKQAFFATVDEAAKTYKVSLAPGYDYNAAITQAPGWGVTTATRSVKPVLTELKTGKTHNLTVAEKEQYTYSGTITGFAQDYDTSGLVVTMIPDDTSRADGAEDVDLTFTGMNFTALLDPGVKYTLELGGVNDYRITTPAQVTSEGGDLTGQTIQVETKALVAASGKFVVLDADDQYAPLYPNSTYEALSATVTKLEFKNVDDGYVYPATVANGGYTVNLRAGAYEAVTTVSGYATKTHVVVGDKAVSKDLLFVSTAPAAVDYVADVYVGNAAKTPNFKTVTGAMAYIKRMTSRGDKRVTVHIAPGTYREQIAIDSKNVTFVNDTPAQEVKLTWYYGISYTYYSASGTSDTDSWYDAEKAFDKFSKPTINVARWGATVRVQAPGFQAENITFESSFNRYLTDEEQVDGVVSNGSTIKVDRVFADVNSKAATERAAALWVDTNSGRGDMTEFKSCKFLSSQDTFGTGKRMYLKDCYIEGMTDFICGPGDVVFDTCTLNWKGYSDNAAAGYLTAPQTGASEKGYLFRNCYVSADTKLKWEPGAMGRTWGAANTKCLFYNTTLQSAGVLSQTTWIAMQGYDPSKPGTAVLLEWGTQLLDGTKVDLSKRTYSHTVAKTEPQFDVETDYFGGWTPEYYVKEVQGVAVDGELSVSDNGDINLPRPGHTLTVSYTLTPEANNANDGSTIQWYAVKDGAETLLKTSTPAEKTYQIQATTVGAQIKVTVTPKTLGGQVGEPKSFTVAETVKEGYEDPSGGTDPVLGKGVNVYLAGDSTVKDYSANGMWTNNKMGVEGSWGEWLQQFFNDKVTVVNYAQGGRSVRSFIEQDGSLAKIDATMKEGDFLFIQFGHNDCYTGDDRNVPLGIAKNDPQKSYAEGGVYPDVSKEANTYHPAGSKTYTAYLKDYLAVAKKHNATAVLMTPVARMYYTSDGKIRPHHDATDFDGTNDNEYCKAVKWVYDWAMDNGYENNVLFMDNFQLTADLFEKAYADCTENNKKTYGMQLMGIDEGTHNSKLGGFIWAGVVAQTIQNSDMTIAKAVQAPGRVKGETPDGKTAFTVSADGAFEAFNNLGGFTDHATYWEGYGQKLFDAIAAKAKELNPGGSNEPGKDPTPPTPPTPSTPSGGGSGSSSTGTKTETVTNLDGSKTTTKTDRKGNTTVTTVAADGAKVESVTTKAGDKTITVTDAKGEIQAKVELPATIPEPEEKFIDVPEGHWAESAINAMAGMGMINGVSSEANIFDMASPITRGSIATILFRLSNGTEGKKTTFADVSGDAWYTDAIGWASSTGVVTGYTETVFGPNDFIAREQMAVMLARYAKLLGMDTRADAAVMAEFGDAASTGLWAIDGMAWCVQKGIIQGKGGNILDPASSVSRAEAAVMLERMIELIKK